MAAYDDELLDAARKLALRRKGQKGRIGKALIRRSISTSYYALFHFLMNEVAHRIVGSGNSLKRRRHVFSRTLTHRGIKLALGKVRGAKADDSVADFMRHGANHPGPVQPPRFVRNLASAFEDAQAKRNDADYDLNKAFSELDARLLRLRVKRVIADWRAADTAADKDFKHGLAILISLKGQLRSDV